MEHRLEHDVDAEFIHGVTGELVSYDVLVAGTHYSLEGGFTRTNPVTGDDDPMVSILVHTVDGDYRYSVRLSQIQP